VKIVDRQTFLAMPAGTVFSEYEPEVFGCLLIKGDTIVSDGDSIDFFYQPVADSLLGYDVSTVIAMMESGQDVPVDLDAQCRDGGFVDHQRYAVWSRADVEALVARLQATLAHGVRFPRKG
jgi:hypothetical protein